MDSATVMIIEDEQFLRTSLADYLEDFGYTTITAASAEEGLQKLLSSEPDVCIVDMRLPDMNGNTFILNANKINPSISFLIFTGSVEYNLPDSLRAIGLTSEDILFKPLADMNVLHTKIQHACQLIQAK